MLNKIKQFINATNEQFQSLTETASPAPIAPQSSEEKIIAHFEDYVAELGKNDNFPKKAIQHLNEILVLSKGINFDDMTIDNQTLVRRIIEVDTRLFIDVYLTIPKAHAVSVILENGKTAKDTLIENIRNLYNKINQICEETITQKTELLLKKQKIAQLKEKRKDFFEL